MRRTPSRPRRGPLRPSRSPRRSLPATRARRRSPPRMTDLPHPLTQHHDELRRRLLRIFGTWAVCFGIALFFNEQCFEILMRPAIATALRKGRTLVALAPAELFMSYIKAALLGGFLVALPMTLYQIWAFISPGLYQAE